MGTTVTLTMGDQQRLRVVQALGSGRVGLEAAAELLGRPGRQVRRIVKRHREEQGRGIPHRSRGRPPANAIPAAVRDRVVEWGQERCRQHNSHRLRDQLAEEHGLELSVSSVRRLRLGAGLSSPRKRRPPEHRSHRPRCPQPGMMLTRSSPSSARRRIPSATSGCSGRSSGPAASRSPSTPTATRSSNCPQHRALPGRATRRPAAPHPVRSGRPVASLKASPPDPPSSPAPDPPPPPSSRAIVKPAANHPWRRYRQPPPKVLQSPAPTEG